MTTVRVGNTSQGTAVDHQGSKKKRKRDLELTFSYTEGHGNHTVSARNSIEAANVVREIVQHAQIVLHDNNVP